MITAFWGGVARAHYHHVLKINARFLISDSSSVLNLRCKQLQHDSHDAVRHRIIAPMISSE